jgi:predicted RNase H-like HicB family nuclease
MYNYAIRFEKDETPGLAVFCRDLPEFHSYGDDEQHALTEAVDGIETALSIYVDQRRKIPEATAAETGEHVVVLPAVTVTKIALWNEMIRRNLKKADLCRLLGVSQTIGDRLVDFTHTSKMEQLEKALDALNTSVRVTPSDVEWIDLPHGGGQAGFYVGRLVDELRMRPNQEIPIGATKSNLDQVKPESLDFFLRSRYAKNPNTMQAVQSVIQAIVDTGKVDYLPRAPGQQAGLLRLK